MSDRQAELRDYYEEEARQGLRRELRGRRSELRDAFIELLHSEQRSSVVDFGAGPGRDGEGFCAAGIQFVGLDLAHANGTLAATRDLTVLQGSVMAPPLRARSFDAGWCMSTLMHLTVAEADVAIRAMADVLTPGAPMLIGVWGGDGQEERESNIDGFDRQFSLRTPEENQAIFSQAGTIDRRETWDAMTHGWHYQVFQLRVAG